MAAKRRCPANMGEVHMAGARFDLQALFAAIDTERKRRALSWAALSRQVGVAASTIRRFDEADDAEADGVLALVRWLNVTPETFIPSASNEGEPLAPRGNGFVRVDMERVRAMTAGSDNASNRRRTTIQRLSEIAASAGRTVSSFTRLSQE